MEKFPNSRPAARPAKQSKVRKMFQTLEKAVEISVGRFENLMKAAEAGKAVAKVLRVQKPIPLSLESEAVYWNKETGTKIFGVVEATEDFDGTFFVVFMRNAKSEKMEAFAVFSRLCFSNFCGNGGVKATFVSKGGAEMGALELECGEHFFHGFKGGCVDGTDEVSLEAVLKVLAAAKPGDAKSATNRDSGLKMMKEWDEWVSTKVMEGIVRSQMAQEGYFSKLWKVAEFCKELGGVEASDVHIIEGTDDGTWGWGGPRKGPKLGAEGVTEEWLAATMPLMMGEDVVEFKEAGGVEFKKGQNKLGKILTTAMRAAAAFGGDHAAFMASEGGIEMVNFKVVVVGAVGGLSPKRVAEEAAEDAPEAKRAGVEAVGRTCSYLN